MRKFLITVAIIAAAGYGAWQYRDHIPYDRIPYLAQLTGQTTQQADAGGGQAVDGQGGGNRKRSDKQETAQQDGQQGAAGQQQGDGQQNGNGQRRRNGAGGPVMVKTVAAVKTVLPQDVTATGWANADDNTTIAAQEQGLITSIVATDGATVKQGDLIATLDDRTAKAAVDKDNAMIVRDNATLTEAETALGRAKDLLTRAAGTQQAYDQAVATRDTAAATVDADKATLASDQVLLEHTQIRAPFDGRLGDIGVSPGAFLNAGAAIVTIAKYDPIYVNFHLQERDLRMLKQSLAAGPVDVVTVPQSPKGKPRQGQISFYDNAVDLASGTILAKARFENASGALWPGQSVNIVVKFHNSEPQVVVPTVAVMPGPDGFFSYVVKDGAVKMAPVTVARANGGFTAVSDGLSEGDHVVVEGQGQLFNSQHVNEQFDDKALNVASTAPVPAMETAQAAEGTAE